MWNSIARPDNEGEQRDVVSWSKNTPLHFFSLSHLLPLHVHSISTIITALQVEFHKGERLSLSASGLEVDWIGQHKNRKMGQCCGGGGRKVPGGKMGPLEEKCQLQSNYNLLSPPQLQLRSSLPADANTTGGYLCWAVAGRFLHFRRSIRACVRCLHEATKSS